MRVFYPFVLLLVNLNICFSQSGWIGQNSGTKARLYCVQFKNLLTGWSTGDSGKIIKTTNGGENWFSLNSGTSKNLKSMFFTSINTGYIVGDSGINIKTTDGGLTWNPLNVPNRYYHFATTFFLNDSTGFVGGKAFDIDWNNKIYNTKNGGISWDSTSSDQADFVRALCFITSKIGWKTGGNGLASYEGVFKTNDGGQNWSWYSTQSGGYNYNSVLFLDSLNGWYAGPLFVTQPRVFRTTNGGNNWSAGTPTIQGVVNSICFINVRLGWAASENKLIHYTSNGGISWMLQTVFQGFFSYRSISFIDSLTGWVAGDSGVIMKTTTGGVITNFTSQSSEIPDDYILHQNFPNPFNPKTTIYYNIQSSSFIRIKIFDVKGNEIASLVNTDKPPGQYEAEFSGNDLASGIYYYSLEVDGVIKQTRKMTLLK